MTPSGPSFPVTVKENRDSESEQSLGRRVAECSASEFECRCGQRRCIYWEKLRDGSKDCEDGSDEEQAITHGTPSDNPMKV